MVFETSVDELYKLRVIPGIMRPNILHTINPLYKYSLSIPGVIFRNNPNDVEKQITINGNLAK